MNRDDIRILAQRILSLGSENEALAEGLYAELAGLVNDRLEGVLDDSRAAEIARLLQAEIDLQETRQTLLGELSLIVNGRQRPHPGNPGQDEEWPRPGTDSALSAQIQTIDDEDADLSIVEVDLEALDAGEASVYDGVSGRNDVPNDAVELGQADGQEPAWLSQVISLESDMPLQESTHPNLPVQTPFLGLPKEDPADVAPRASEGIGQAPSRKTPSLLAGGEFPIDTGDPWQNLRIGDLQESGSPDPMDGIYTAHEPAPEIRKRVPSSYPIPASVAPPDGELERALDALLSKPPEMIPPELDRPIKPPSPALGTTGRRRVNIGAVMQFGQQLISGRTVEVGPMSLILDAGAPVPLGEITHIFFELATGAQLGINCRVREVKESPAGDGLHRIELEFLDLSTGDRDALMRGVATGPT